MLITNILIGIATWALFAAMGIQGATLWGVFAGLLHVIPYAGNALVAVAAAIAALVQLGSLTTALVLAAGTVAIAVVIGIGLNTWLSGYLNRINPVVVFAGLLFFGWLWGAWGLILAVPLLAVFKSIAERVDSLQTIAELMDA
jgi:predicted PurR-regulated permease PerM